MTVFRSWSLDQWLLRIVIALAPLLALVASLPAEAHPWAQLFVVVLVLSVASAYWTDTSMGLVAMLLVLFWWGSRVPEPLSAWVLVAAAALLAGQVAAVLADYGPPTLRIERAVLTLWVRRGALVFVAAPIAWLMARLVDEAPDQPGIWVAGLAAGLAAVVAAIVSLGLSEPG